MGVLTTLFRPRRVFRPEVEALLDAEMDRHRQAIQNLTEYALEQQEIQAAESAGESTVGEETTSPYNGPERRATQPGKSWMRPPLTTEDAPSSAGSLLAATLAVGDSTDRLGDKIEGLTVQRRGITLLLTVTCVVTILFSVFGGIALQKISRVDTTAQGLTSQRAQQDQIARADYRTDRTIFCINSFAASLTDPSKPYDSRCPQAYPGVPITGTPPSP